VNDMDALRVAQRLGQLGVMVRSPELAQRAKEVSEFNARGGNRAMRRARKRQRK
jgi:hypothetical protein